MNACDVDAANVTHTIVAPWCASSAALIALIARFRNVGDDWSCAPENHLPEGNVKLFRRIPEGLLTCLFLFFICIDARTLFTHIVGLCESCNRFVTAAVCRLCSCCVHIAIADLCFSRCGKYARLASHHMRSWFQLGRVIGWCLVASMRLP